MQEANEDISWITFENEGNPFVEGPSGNPFGDVGCMGSTHNSTPKNMHSFDPFAAGTGPPEELVVPSSSGALRAPSQQAAAHSPPPFSQEQQPNAAWAHPIGPAIAPVSSLPPTVAEAAAAAAAATFSNSGAAPAPSFPDPISRPASTSPGLQLHNLESLLHQDMEETEEAAEQARLRRIREIWKGLVAPKAQRCSREGMDGASSSSRSSISLRERFSGAPKPPRTSLELRMAAAEAVHLAHRASPAPDSLFGVEEHLVPVQDRPPSAPLAPFEASHFPSPGPFIEPCRQRSASVPNQSPQLSFLGSAEQQQQDQHPPSRHELPWSSSQQMGVGGLAALLDGGAPGHGTNHASDLGADSEGLCAYDAGGSALELRMAAAEALAVTQRAAWEQQQQLQHDALLEKELQGRNGLGVRGAARLTQGLPAAWPWEASSPQPGPASAEAVSHHPTLSAPLLAAAAAAPAAPMPIPNATATPPHNTTHSQPSAQHHLVAPRRAPPPPPARARAPPPVPPAVQLHAPAVHPPSQLSSSASTTVPAPTSQLQAPPVYPASRPTSLPQVPAALSASATTLAPNPFPATVSAPYTPSQMPLASPQACTTLPPSYEQALQLDGQPGVLGSTAGPASANSSKSRPGFQHRPAPPPPPGHAAAQPQTAQWQGTRGDGFGTEPGPFSTAQQAAQGLATPTYQGAPHLAHRVQDATASSVPQPAPNTMHPPDYKSATVAQPQPPAHTYMPSASVIPKCPAPPPPPAHAHTPTFPFSSTLPTFASGYKQEVQHDFLQQASQLPARPVPTTSAWTGLDGSVPPPPSALPEDGASANATTGRVPHAEKHAAKQERRQEKKQQKEQLLQPQDLSSPLKHHAHTYLLQQPMSRLPTQDQHRARHLRHPSLNHRPPPPVPPQQPLDSLSAQPVNDSRVSHSDNQQLNSHLGHTCQPDRSISSLQALSAAGSSGQLKGGQDMGAQGAPVYTDPSSTCRDDVCVEVRLPPMNLNKDMVEPRLLATGLGNLFCMPGPPGQAMLNWADAHGHLGLPQGQIHAAQEDLDSTPCVAVALPDPTLDIATSVYVDELGSAMWTGHNSGKVCRWHIGQSKGVRCEQNWLAHRDHKVQALAVTPWGELWTGSTYGTIRLWACNHPGGANVRTPAKICDIQRLNGLRPHSKLYCLACSTTGRVMWSVGRSMIMLWDTYTGANLGALRLVGEGPVGMDPESKTFWIDPAKGLDPSLLCRSFRMRTTHRGAPGEDDLSGDEDEYGGMQDAMKGDRSIAWGAKLTKGVGHVGKFAARVGKRTTQLAASVPQRFGRHVRTRSNGEPVVLEGGDAWGVEISGGSGTGGLGVQHKPKAKESGLAKGDKGKACALVASLDGFMVVVYKSGLLEKYTELGRKVWTARVPDKVLLHSALLVGSLLWLGCSDGCLRLFDAASGRTYMHWRAHLYPVKSIAIMGTTVFSLARDGSIRGWPSVQPPPPAAVEAWREGNRVSLRCHPLRVVAGTWNVNSSRPSMRSLYEWLGCHADGADLVCVGLQEVEMGTSSVATDAVRNMLNRAALEKGNANAQWWSDQMLTALGGEELFSRVALRQMSGILMITFCRTALVPHVGEVATSSVACGLMGVVGNKGAAAISLSLYRRRLIFLSSHFAAHLEKLEERNADYARIVRCLRFENTSATPPTSPRAMATGQNPFAVEDDPWAHEGAELPQVLSSNAAEGLGSGLRDADVVIWMGDFNYRLSAPYEWTVARAEAGAGAFAELLGVDQLRQEMARGVIFHGLSEGPLLFPPTYKFDKGVPATELRPLPYDSSDKKRVPAWTDRILWRGSLPLLPGSTAASSHEEDVSLALLTEGLEPSMCRVSLTAASGVPNTSNNGAMPALGTKQPSNLAYGSAMNVCDSDHKPVWCKLQLQLPAHVQQQKRRMSQQVLNEIRKELAPRAPPLLTLHIQTSQPTMSHQVLDDLPTLVLKRDDVEEVLVKNPGSVPILMSVVGDGKRLPLWLEVQPASCLVLPRSSVRLTFQAAAPDGSMQGLGGAAALRSQEVILQVWGQHLTSLGRRMGAEEHYHRSSDPEVAYPLLLRVQSLLY